MQGAESQMEAWRVKISHISDMEDQILNLQDRNKQLEADLKQASAAAQSIHSLQDKLDASQEQVAMLQHCAEAVHSYGSAWLPLTESLKDTAQRDAQQFHSFLQDCKQKVSRSCSASPPRPAVSSPHTTAGERCGRISGVTLCEEAAGGNGGPAARLAAQQGRGRQAAPDCTWAARVPGLQTRLAAFESKADETSKRHEVCPASPLG